MRKIKGGRGGGCGYFMKPDWNDIFSMHISYSYFDKTDRPF
jgi:hypothetical protein